MSVCHYCLVPPCLVASCCFTQRFLPSEKALRSLGVAPSTRWQLVGRAKLLSPPGRRSTLLLHKFPPAFSPPCRWPAVPLLLQKYVEGTPDAWCQRAEPTCCSVKVLPASQPPASASGQPPGRFDARAGGRLQRPMPASAPRRVEAPLAGSWCLP